MRHSLHGVIKPNYVVLAVLFKLAELSVRGSAQPEILSTFQALVVDSYVTVRVASGPAHAKLFESYEPKIYLYT